MKNTELNFDYTGKKFSELKENEIFELLNITVKTARKAIIKGKFDDTANVFVGAISNVRMIDEIMRENFDDLVSQSYIYAYAKSEKYPLYNAFQIAYYASLQAYRKLIDETIGKRSRKRVEGKRVETGRHLNASLDDESNMIMKTESEKEYKSTDYIELKIDMERILTDDELSIVEYRKEGYTMQEIAIIKQTYKMDISRKCDKIKKKMIAYK